MQIKHHDLISSILDDGTSAVGVDEWNKLHDLLLDVPIGEADYVLGWDGALARAFNVRTGVVKYNGTDYSAVFNQASAELTSYGIPIPHGTNLFYAFPPAPTIGTPIPSGSVTPGEHWYALGFVSANGETQSGYVAGVNVAGAGNKVPLSWAAPPPGTTGIRVYRTNANSPPVTGSSSREPGVDELLCLTPVMLAPNVLSYNDTAADLNVNTADSVMGFATMIRDGGAIYLAHPTDGTGIIPITSSLQCYPNTRLWSPGMSTRLTATPAFNLTSGCAKRGVVVDAYHAPRAHIHNLNIDGNSRAKVGILQLRNQADAVPNRGIDEGTSPGDVTAGSIYALIFLNFVTGCTVTGIQIGRDYPSGQNDPSATTNVRVGINNCVGNPIGFLAFNGDGACFENNFNGSPGMRLFGSTWTVMGGHVTDEAGNVGCIQVSGDRDKFVGVYFDKLGSGGGLAKIPGASNNPDQVEVLGCHFHTTTNTPLVKFNGSSQTKLIGNDCDGGNGSAYVAFTGPSKGQIVIGNTGADTLYAAGTVKPDLYFGNTFGGGSTQDTDEGSASGAGPVTVNHVCDATPANIQLSPNNANSVGIYVQSRGPSSFVVAGGSGTLDFDWVAKI